MIRAYVHIGLKKFFGRIRETFRQTQIQTQNEDEMEITDLMEISSFYLGNSNFKQYTYQGFIWYEKLILKLPPFLNFQHGNSNYPEIPMKKKKYLIGWKFHTSSCIYNPI